MLYRLDAAVSATAGTVTGLLAAWLLLSLLTAVALRVTEGSAGGRTRRVLDRALRLLAPGLVGRAVRAAVGLGAAGTALVAGVGLPLTSAVAQAAVPAPGPALLQTTPVADPVSARQAVTAVVAGSPQPTTDLWPLSPTPLSPHGPRLSQGQLPPASRPRGENPAPSSVVVLRGDTLWAIAARHLPEGAPNASIDAAWRRWFEVNRAVIGPNPDLLLPGQILVSPGRVLGVPR